MKSLALVLALVLVSCSKNNSPGSQTTPDTTMQLSMAPVTINLNQIGPDLTGATSDASTSIVWSDTVVGASNTQVITFMAKTAINPFNKAALEALQIFKLKSTTCGTSLAARRSCSATLEFKPASPGAATETLSLSPGASWQLSASATPAPVILPTSAGLSISPLNVNLGDFTGMAKTSTISISNTTTATKDLLIDTAALNKFTVTSNSCPVGTLASRRSCQIKVSYTSADLLESDEVRQENITINSDAIIALSVTHKAKVQEVNGPFSVTPSVLDLGNLSSPKTQKFTFSNATASMLNSLSFSSLAPGVSVVSNSCSSTLARSRICAVELKFDSALMFTGPFVMDYSFSNTTTSAQATISAVVSGGVPLSVPCSLANAQSNLWDTTNALSASGDKVGNDISSCRIDVCKDNFSLDNSGRQCVPSIVACVAGNGSGTQSWTGAAYSSCSLNACDDNYSLSSGICSPIACTVLNAGIDKATIVVGNKVTGCQATECETSYEVTSGSCSAIACTVLNSGINNAAQVSGTKVSGCVLDTCIAEYDKVGNSCSPTSCTTLNSVGNGLTSVSNVASVSGTINDNSCLVATCDTYYKVAGDNKSCLVKSCNELTGSELSSLSYNLTGATISGTYPSCSLTCSSSYQQLAADNKSCIDKNPTVTALTITNKNAAGYVKDNNLELSITGTNAQQMRFSFTSNCSSAVYENFASTKSLPVSSLNLGSTQQVYVQLKNGSLETTCFSVSGAQTVATSSSFVHDSIAPDLTIVSPVTGASVSSASVSVTGACSVGTNVTIKEVGQSENSVTCASSSYTYSLALSAATGTKTIEVKQIDLAGNSSVVNVYITKTGPPDTPLAFECQTSSNRYPYCRWDAVSGATSYRFYKSTTINGTYSLVTSSSSPSAVSMNDRTEGATYYYKVSSYNASGESPQSAAVGVTNIKAPSPSVDNQKNSFRGVINSQSLSSVNISWDNSLLGATQYLVSEHSVYPSYAGIAYSFNVPTPISSTVYASSVSSATVNLSSTAPTWLLVEGINVIGTNTSRAGNVVLLKKEVGSLLYTRNFISSPSLQTGESFFDTGTTSINASGLFISEPPYGPAGYTRDFSDAGDSFVPTPGAYYTVRLTFNSVVSANNGSYLVVHLGNQNDPASRFGIPFSKLVGKTSIDMHVQFKTTQFSAFDQIWITPGGSYNSSTQRSSLRITKFEIFD